MDVTSELNNVLQTIIRVVLIPVLPVLASFLIALIKKKTAELESKIKNESLTKYIDMAEDAVISSINAVKQVYTDELIKKTGILSNFEKKVAFEMARERVIKILSSKVKSTIGMLYSDFDSWLEGRIEYYTNEIESSPSDINTRLISA